MFDNNDNSDLEWLFSTFEFLSSDFGRWFFLHAYYFWHSAENKEFVAPIEEIEKYYHSVYVPVMAGLEKPLRKMISEYYPHTAHEQRPKLRKEIDNDIKEIGHNFLLEIFKLVWLQKAGNNLREAYSNLDVWEKGYSYQREPKYFPDSFFDRFSLNEEDKQKLIAESRLEAEEDFALKEKPRFEFFNLIQSILFKYYDEVTTLNTDGWIVFQDFLYYEFTLYQISFNRRENFIEYGFGVEDMAIPYPDYMKILLERMSLKNSN